MATKAFHFLGCKKSASAVRLLEWSPKFDLLAVISKEGSVSLHRSNSFQRIWEIPLELESLGPAVSLAWRPDGRVLAIGYERGRVRLYSLEGVLVNGNPQGPACMHDVTVSSSAVCVLEWFGEHQEENGSESEKPFYVQFSDALQPDVPVVAMHWLGEQLADSSSCEFGLDSNEALLPGKRLDLLVAGDEGGCVELFLCGLLELGRLCLAEDMKPVDVCLSQDWSTLSITGVLCGQEGQSTTAHRHLYDVSAVLASRHEVASLCRLYGTVQALSNYLNWSVQVIIDSWEDVMEQLNAKLSELATELKDLMAGVTMGSLLLRLLSRGSLPWFAFVFLQRELSEGALLRVSSRLTACYDTMHKTIVHSLQPALQYLLVKCQDGVGMMAFRDRFSCFGAEAEAFHHCVRSVATMSLKCAELMTVMSKSSEDLECFLKWLQCLSTTGVLAPPKASSKDVSKEQSIDKSDMRHVSKFITSTFCAASDSANSRNQFDMEHVGQYLRNEVLSRPHQCDDTPLDEMMSGLLAAVEQCDWSFSRVTTTSLVQDCWAVSHAIRDAFSPVSVAFSGLFSLQSSLAIPSHCLSTIGFPRHCFSSALVPDTACGLCHVSSSKTSLTVLLSSDDRRRHRAINVHFSEESADGSTLRHEIVDADWYRENLHLRSRHRLTVLLSSSALVQLDMAALLDQYTEISSACTHLLLPSQGDQVRGRESEDTVALPSVNALPSVSLSRDMETASVAGVAVGGDRQLACVIAGNNHLLKFFDLAQEEEDDSDGSDGEVGEDEDAGDEDDNAGG